ncbi:MAG TPA: hypothetical protein H9892_00245 [Candidatus Protoclostridium stercorigallinarum]|uniref:Uncharacterized protein n=1 Tax=Candidatus Protoclostridium stercorigallinarum TaxID=2838741 RepID=A0A9D1TQH6_9FIRM|nr:hypothetical protein [Candidatus Protoclostridium stercorigallinarum]
MKCSDPACGKTITRPLELYDGRLACPYCKKIIGASGGGFRISAKSDTLFRQSEICFLRWLSSDDKYGKESMRLLDNAVDLCKEAALEGDPRAAVRLGYYYDKDFVETNRSEEARCRVAYNYYASVCFDRSVGAFPTERGVTAPDRDELRLEAAQLLLGMLALTPDEFDAIEMYNFARNKAEAERLLGVRFPVRRAATAAEPDRVKEASLVLASCFASGRTPLFGMFRLGGDELAALVSGDDFGKLLGRRRIRLGVYAEAEGGGVDARDRMQMLTNRALVRSVVPMYSGRTAYLYFYDTRGPGAVMSALEADNGRLLKTLAAEGGRSSYVFYDDDITMYNKGGQKRAAERLINAVIQG